MGAQFGVDALAHCAPARSGRPMTLNSLVPVSEHPPEPVCWKK